MYTLEIEQEDDGRYLAEVVERPGCLAYGTTMQEAAVAALTLLEAAEDAEDIAAADAATGPAIPWDDVRRELK